MTAERFHECLASLRWSLRGLAAILECDDRLVRRWASPTDPAKIPPAIADWLEGLTQAHELLPPPEDWRRR